MTTTTRELSWRCLVYKETEGYESFWVAQILEHDLVARARTVKEIRDVELYRAIAIADKQNKDLTDSKNWHPASGEFVKRFEDVARNVDFEQLVYDKTYNPLTLLQEFEGQLARTMCVPHHTDIYCIIDYVIEGPVGEHEK